MTAQRYGYVRNEQARRNPDVEPSLDSLVIDYMGAVPPEPLPPRPGDVIYQPPVPVPGSQVVPRQ
jgi:general secretion pathway protein D